MTTCPHCGQPMPRSRIRREPVQESLPETDQPQLAALSSRNLWGHPDTVWQVRAARSQDSGTMTDDQTEEPQ